MAEQLSLFPMETVTTEPPKPRTEPKTVDGMVVFSFCLPPDDAATLRRRAGNNVSGYVRKRLTYDLKRDHHGRTNKHAVATPVVNERGDGETR